MTGDAEAPSDAQKALAEPPKKEEAHVQPMLGKKAQDEAVESAADVNMMTDDKHEADSEAAKADEPVTTGTETPGADIEAVGHSMVEGAAETAKEIDQAAEELVTQDVLDTMPAALDDEVAEVVAKEEAKAALPPTPSPPLRASPLPATAAAAISTLTDDQTATRKRSASGSPVPEKRRRLSPAPVASPPSTSASTSITYPSGPSRVLYITNLRRPLLLPTLHSFLFPSSTPHAPTASSPLPESSRPFSDPDCPGVWLGPIKDHAFAAYASSEDAQEAKGRMEGVKWPEDTGAELRVVYMPDDAVEGVIAKEQAAWKAGRQRLSVQVNDVEKGRVEVRVLNQKGEEYVMPVAPPSAPSGPKGRAPMGPGGMRGQGMGGFNNGRPMMGHGQGQGMGGRPNMHMNNNQGMGIRGRGGMGDSYNAARDGPLPTPGARLPLQTPVTGGDGRLGRPINRTMTRPSLVWKEGPGATA